jgi:hypothetical protein
MGPAYTKGKARVLADLTLVVDVAPGKEKGPTTGAALDKDKVCVAGMALAVGPALDRGRARVVSVALDTGPVYVIVGKARVIGKAYVVGMAPAADTPLTTGKALGVAIVIVSMLAVELGIALDRSKTLVTCAPLGVGESRKVEMAIGTARGLSVGILSCSFGLPT